MNKPDKIVVTNIDDDESREISEIELRDNLFEKTGYSIEKEKISKHLTECQLETKRMADDFIDWYHTETLDIMKNRSGMVFYTVLASFPINSFKSTVKLLTEYGISEQMISESFIEMYRKELNEFLDEMKEKIKSSSIEEQ